jgi:hypothetical protein
MFATLMLGLRGSAVAGALLLITKASIGARKFCLKGRVVAKVLSRLSGHGDLALLDASGLVGRLLGS